MTTSPTGNPTVRVNQPESGTYGEKAEVNRLRSALPSSGARPPGGPGAGPPGMPAPVPGALRPQGRPPGGPPPPGVPGAIMSPSDRPGQPVNSRLNQPQQAQAPSNRFAGAASAAAARVALLQQLASAPDVSEATREWAKMLVEALGDGA